MILSTLEDINRRMQQENNSYNRDLNRLQQEILKLKERHQRNMASLKSEKERTSQNQQLEDFNKLLEFALS